MSLFGKIKGGVKSAAKSLGRGAKTVAKGATKGMNALGKGVNTVTKPLNKAWGYVSKPLNGSTATAVKKGVFVAAATAVGGPLVGAATASGIKQTGKQLDIKAFAKDTALNAASNGAAKTAASNILQKTSVGKKALGVATTVKNTVNPVVQKAEQAKSMVQKTVTSPFSKVETIVQTTTNKGQAVVTKVSPFSVPPVVKPLAITNQTIMAMAQKVMQKGTLNINNVTETLLKSGVQPTAENIASVTKGVSESVKSISGMSPKITDTLTTSTLKTMIPNLSSVQASVQKSGFVDLSKVSDTLKKTGIEASQEVVRKVGEAIQNSVPDDVKIKGTGGVKNNTGLIYGLVGLAVAALFIMLRKK